MEGMMRYYRFCAGLNDAGTLIPMDESVFKHTLDPKKDYYRSIFYYNEEQKRTAQEVVHTEKGAKQRGISGIENTVTNRLVFDFDNEKAIDLAKKDAVEICERLIESGVNKDDLQIAFSGKKGFSVEILSEEFFTPTEVKNMAINLAGDLATFDNKIYNASRILRVPLTIHKDTNLYKFPLDLQELKTLSIDQIKAMAIKPDGISLDGIWKPKPLPGKIMDLKGKSIEKVVASSVSTELFKNVDQVDWSKRIPFLSPAKYVLHLGLFPPGVRHECFMILAATYRAVGFDKGDAYRLLKSVAQRQSEINTQDRFGDEELYQNILGAVYSPTWIGGQYGSDNPVLMQVESKLPPHIRRIKESNISGVESGLDEFVQYAENIDKNTMKFGIPSLDKKLHVQVGHLVGMLAPPGLGKTSFLLTILNNTSRDGVNSIFFSYDMYQSIVFQKLIQRETGYTSEKVFDIFKNNNKEEKTKIEKLLKENYDNVGFCFKSGQSIEDMKKTIIERELATGKEIKLVGVDYSELVLSQFSDPTQRSAEVIQGLREIANDMHKCVVVLLQPNKVNSKPNEPILGYSAAKGSSTISQACSAMITAHRPGYSSEHPEDDKFFSINCVKNRMGSLFALDFSWDGLTGRIGELSEEQKFQLKDIRQRLKEEKDAKGDGW